MYLNVTFESFQQQFLWLGMREYSDREGLIFKQSSLRSGQDIITRVLGTTFHLSSDNYYLIGKSMTSYSRSNVDVLHRKAKDWDPENNRFVHPLGMKNVDVPAMPEKLVNDEVDELRLNGFNLTWRREAGISPRMWCSDVCSVGQVIVGKVQITMPAIYLHGNASSMEFSNLLSESFCKTIV